MRKENNGDLEEYIKNNSRYNCLSERAAKFVVEDGLLALNDLYDIGLFHRDIKLKNFVISGIENYPNGPTIDENGCADVKLYVKLIDFDFVDYINKDDHRRIGAIFYMSPQIVNSDKYKNPDVFSLGMLWFKALTGE